jgi:beta-mannosidase
VDYVKLFEYLLPRAVYAEDSATPYWNSSPSSGGSFDDPDDENRGDSHYWDVWHGDAGFEEYRRHYFRFLSEFGFQSFPNIKTVRSFTGEVDRNIFSPVMESHQKSPSGNVKILRHISENFRYPRDFVQLLYVSQIMQGIAVKSCVEHMRQNRGRCMGTFFWQFNDCWPAVSWSSVDYYGRWKLLQYMARKFYAPIAGIVTVDGTVVQAFAANDTSEQVGVKVRTSLFAMDGREITHYVDETKVPADSSVGLKPKNFARQMEANGIRDVFICVDFDFSNGMKQSEVVPFVPYKHLNLKEAQVDIAVDELEDSYEITINSDVYTPFVTVDLRKGDAIFSDNAVPVFKNRPAVITVRKDDIKNVKLESADDFIDILEIYTLQGSFDMGDLDYE